MKKRVFSWLAMIALLVSMMSGFVVPVTADSDIPYMKDYAANSDSRSFLIADQADLEMFAQIVNSGEDFAERTVYQVADIRLSGEFTPIGGNNSNASDPNFAQYFCGTYDGQFHYVSNLQINRNTVNGVGFFGACRGATIKNFGIESGSVSGQNRVGAIAGYGDVCTFINCYNKASVTSVGGTDGAGGLAGVARESASFYGCFNMGTVRAQKTAAAGIAGWGQGNVTIRSCYNEGSVISADTAATASDAICRNSATATVNFSDSWYLKGSCSKNNFKATAIEEPDYAKLAYIMNRATGHNTGAFTVDEGGDIVFKNDDLGAVYAIDINLDRSGVVLNGGTYYFASNGEGYEVPDFWEDDSFILYAIAGGETYYGGETIDLNGISSITLVLDGTYPNVREAELFPDAPIMIVESADDLYMMAGSVNKGTTFAGKTIYVVNDLDFSEYPTWTTIGTVVSSSGGVASADSTYFAGTFDGQYHHFKNINFKQSGDYQALFGYLEGATVQNIIIDEGKLVGNNNRTAVLCALVRNSTVQNIENHLDTYSSATGMINSGVVALSVQTNLRSIVQYGTSGVNNTDTQENGGIAGYGFSNSNIHSCYVVGNVYGGSSDQIARNGGTVTESYYLSREGRNGTIEWAEFLTDETAWKLNTATGTLANSGSWAMSATGPVLNPEKAGYRAGVLGLDANGAELEETYVYAAAGASLSLKAPAGYTLSKVVYENTEIDSSWKMPAEDIQITAYYNNEVYDIIYRLNGGSFVSTPVATHTAGYAQMLPNAGALVRDGYLFAGWYDNEALAGDAVDVVPADLYRDVVYYAAWTVPTEISTPEQLIALASGDLSGSYRLTADLDMTGYEFTPIGTPDEPFTGYFDGNGHVISNLLIVGERYVGLFGCNAGVIANVHMDDSCEIDGNSYVGGIAGSNTGTIVDCISEAMVICTEAQELPEYKIMSQNLCVWGDGGFSVANRQPRMLQRIYNYDPDVICFQEGSETWVNYLGNNLSGYTFLYKYRSDKEAVPIAYKTNKFSVVESGHFWLSDTPEVESKGWDGACYRICTYAVVQDKANGEMIAFFSIHLDHQGAQARKNGAALIRNRIEALRERFPGIMTFTAGDYNTTEYTEAYNAHSTNGMADTRYIADITTTTNTHGSAETEAQYLAEGASSKIDFIMTFEDAVHISKFQVLDECISGYRLSDHNGLLATFTPSGSTNFGGIAGINSGEIDRSFSIPYLEGGKLVGTIAGQNKGTLNEVYHYDFEEEIAAVGKGESEGAIYQPTFTAELMWQINRAAGKTVYTVEEEYPAFANGNAAIPVCLTINGTPTYLFSGTKYTLDLAGYTDPVCAMDGIYFEGATFTVPAHDAEITVTEATECGTNCTGSWLIIDDETHRWVCDANASHYTEGGHNWVDAEPVAPTCDDAGYEWQVCSDCGDEKIGETLNAIGHKWGEYVPYDENDHYRSCINDPSHLDYAAHRLDAGVYVEETCISMSYTKYSCLDCDYDHKVYLEPANDHSWGDWIYSDEENHIRTCIYEASHIETEAHDYKSSAQSSTCDEPGGIRYTCTGCGHSYLVGSGESLGHNYGNWISTGEEGHKKICANDPTHVIYGQHTMETAEPVAPTCDSKGYTRHFCTDCDYYYDTDIEEASGHDWGEWTVESDATETAQGLLKRVCDACSGEETRVIPIATDAAVVLEATTDAESETVIVTGKLQNNPGIASLQLELTYDAEALMIENADALVRGDALPDMLFGSGIEANLESGSFKLTWFGAENDTADGTLFTLTFKVLEEGETRIGIRVVEDMVYNEDYEAVELLDRDITVDVSFEQAPQILLGDVNDDGQVNASDVVMLMKVCSGASAEYNALNADVNQNGIIDSADVVALMRKQIS